MCWIGKCDVKIAKRDFYVYKLGKVSDRGFKSLYQNFIYEPKEINKKVELNPIQFFLDESSYVIYEGYHSYLTEKMAKCSREEYDEIGIFEIPAGATIYVNYRRREVVSTDIKYLGLLEE